MPVSPQQEAAAAVRVEIIRFSARKTTQTREEKQKPGYCSLFTLLAEKFVFFISLSFPYIEQDCACLLWFFDVKMKSRTFCSLTFSTDELSVSR